MTVPAFGVFVLLPGTELGRMDQAVREVADVAELHAAIDDAMAKMPWRAITIFRGEDIPRALEGAAGPTPMGE